MSPPSAAARDRRSTVVGSALVIGGLAAVVWLADHAPYDAWGPLLMLVLVALVSRWLIHGTVHGSEDPLLGRILLAALLLKLVAALVRHYFAFEIYEGATDAGRYHEAGLAIQENFRSGLLTFDGDGFSGGSETRNIGVVTGAIYTLFGGARLIGYLGFAWLGWIGQALFVRAFRVGFPTGDLRRYALLVLFLPSLLFWPAGIGKEACMCLALGWASLGVAHLVGPAPRLGRGALHLAAGLLLALQIRPHVTLLVAIAIFAALLARRPDRRTATAVTTRVALLLLLIPVTIITVNRLDEFFGVEDFTPTSITEVLDRTIERTEQGGSQFEAKPVRSPGDVPQAVVSVLVRPFPWEVVNGPMLLASAETVTLLAIAALSWRRLLHLPRHLVSNPYLAYATAFTLAFIIAFSNIANQGILARQRTQTLPLFLTLLALPAVRRAPGRALVDRSGAAPRELIGG